MPSSIVPTDAPAPEGRYAGDEHHLVPSGMVLSEVFPPQNGGSGKWLWEIYGRQPANRYLMVVGDSFGADSRDETYAQPVVRIALAMPFRGISRFDSVCHYWRQICATRRLVREHGIKVIHAARPLPEGLIARCVKLFTGVPYVCYVHGEDVNIAMTSRELKLLTNSVLQSSSRVIANSTFTQSLLLNDWSVPADKISLMHPGVDTEYFAPATQHASRPSGWDGRKVILTVGRLQKRKGHDTVIRVLPQLIDKHPDLLYVVAGDGEERDGLQDLANSLGVAKSIEFVGEIDDVTLRRYYQHCDVFVLANRTIGKDVEGFGIVLLEAQACGKPVIAGDSGGTSDTMLPGQTGIVVNCDTTDPLANEVDQLLSDADRRKSMGSQGQRFVNDHFGWSQLSRQAEKIFLSSLPGAAQG